MTDRGLPIVDGAPACPFVAFEDDRDGRATAPDHRHRCFAEPRPAPRALAHQEAYCLSSAFPVCPTFQDWARREAAAARPRPADDAAPLDEPPVSRPMPPVEREPRHAPGTDTPPPLPPRRNPHRDWAAPPPWTGDDEPAGQVEPPSFLAGRRPDALDDDWRAASRGLAGSAADRLAGPDPDAEPPLPRATRPALPVEDDDLDDWAAPVPRVAPARGAEPPGPGRTRDRDAGRPERAYDRPADRGADAAARRDHVRRRSEEEAAELFGPAWERPQRYEAYPSLRTRMSLAGLPGLPGFSRLGIGVVALILAAVTLFFVGPMLLGIGGSGPNLGGATPSPSAVVTAPPSPTATPAPTPTVYVVAKGDTMSGIAKRFGVTIDQILAANPQVKNPDKITIGDALTIPVPEPTSLPNEVGGSTAP
jgi:nucleoid-associated protein YgaU